MRRHRPGPLGAMSDKDLVAEIRQLLQARPMARATASCRASGIRTSRRRVLRLVCASMACWPISVPAARMAREPMTARSPPSGSTCGQRSDVGHRPARPGCGVSSAVDRCSAECVGLHASRSADRFEALEPVRQAVRVSAPSPKAPPPALTNSATIMAARQPPLPLGIESSPAFVREPEGNGCADRFIQGAEENCSGWYLCSISPPSRSFASALIAFKQTYNHDLDHRAAPVPDTS